MKRYKVITSIVASVLLVSIFSSTLPNRIEAETVDYIVTTSMAENDKVILNSETIDRSSLRELSANHFLIQEGNNIYDQEFFVDANIVRINGRDYNLTSYMNVLTQGPATITDVSNRLVALPNTDTSLTNNSIKLRRTLPTTGYSSLLYLNTRKKVNMTYVATSAAAAVLGAFLKASPSVSMGIIKRALKSAIKAGVISYGTQKMTTTAYYDLYQAYHKTVSGAYKEQRRPFVKFGGKKYYDINITYYFWSVRP